jgi:hypothetical protein
MEYLSRLCYGTSPLASFFPFSHSSADTIRKAWHTFPPLQLRRLAHRRWRGSLPTFRLALVNNANDLSKRSRIIVSWPGQIMRWLVSFGFRELGFSWRYRWSTTSGEPLLCFAFWCYGACNACFRYFRTVRRMKVKVTNRWLSINARKWYWGHERRPGPLNTSKIHLFLYSEVRFT